MSEVQDGYEEALDENEVLTWARRGLEEGSPIGDPSFLF